MRIASISMLLVCATSLSYGQTVAPLQPKDYGQWETIAGGQGQFGPPAFGLSPDGNWLFYQVSRSNRNNELRIIKSSGGDAKVVGFGAQPAFSSDSMWLAYGIGISEAQDEKLRKEKKPVQRKLGLMNLTSGVMATIDNVESFAFSPNGAYLAMRRYAPEKAPAKEGAEVDAEAPTGATLLVRTLSTGKDTSFGNVSEFAWQDMPKTGHLLAMAMNAEDKAGNGVQLFDPSTGSLQVLDSAPASYVGLAWRKKSADLAVLRSKSDDKFEGPTYSVMAWKGLVGSNYDPTKDAKFPTGMRVVSYRRLAWADDANTIYVGYAKWALKPPKAKKGDKDEKQDEDEPATVDVWHWRDTDVMAKQKTGARMDLQRNLLAAWHLDSGAFIPLAHTLTEQVTPLKSGKASVVADWSGFTMERTIGRPAADIALVNNATGERTKVLTKLPEDHYLQPSPGGRYLLYFLQDNYWAVPIDTRIPVNLTRGIATSFANRESDATVKQKPPFGFAGWTKGDASVILYDKTDLWEVPLSGSKARRLTDGAADQIRHRYIRLDSEEEFIDLSKPFYVSLFGIWTKKSGYARIEDGKETRLVLEDRSIDRLTKAKEANTYAYLSQTFEHSPNVFIGTADLANAKAITNTNPAQSKYAWGREELVEYKNSKGERLQGALYYPAGYEAGKQYPMVVYIYERLSDGLHHYSPPSERDYYNPGAITSHGYFLLEPDIAFVPREPGLSVVDCVGAAVKKVVQMGVIDPKKVGVVGHSWGGFDTTFLATHTEIFAAAVAGAPITDLVSNYGNHHWSSGIAETDHIETGQQRMEVPLWEDLQAYIRNSAIFNVQNMKTPLMIEVGDADGTVFYHQGIELYNIARRAQKNVVLLVYGGEDHGLRKKADQIDYQRRIFAWFGHYLKGEPAPDWITSGESYQQHQQELKNAKAARGGV